MKLTLRFFASVREALGSGETIEAGEGATVGTVRAALIARGEPHASQLAQGRAVRCALNRVVCDETALLADGDELAFFPPVTGG